MFYGKTNVIMVNYEQIQPFLESLGNDYYISQTSLALKLEDNLNDEQIEQAQSYLTENRLSVISFEKLYSNTKSNEANDFVSQIILFAVCAVYTLLAIASLSVFQLYKTKKQYCIYYICEMEN